MLVKQWLTSGEINFVHAKVMEFPDQVKTLLFGELLFVSVEARHYIAELALIIACFLQVEIDS